MGESAQRLLLATLVGLLLGSAPVAADWLIAERDWQALSGLEPTQSLDLVAPTRRQTDARLRFSRVDLYAPGARVWKVTAQGRTPLPLSGQRVLRGHDPVRSDQHLVLVFSANGELAAGAVHGERGLEALRTYRDVDGVRLRAYPVEALLPDGASVDFVCANDSLPTLGTFNPTVPRATAPVRADTLRLGVLAIDTDKEWLQRRFGDDTSTAQAWIEQLMATTNLIFERDLNLRMLQGDTLLRVGSDPYQQNASPVNRAVLEEFGAYWASQYGDIVRTHAALISGRSSAENRASGIAWLNSYCRTASLGGSYSVNQLYYASWVAVAGSASIFAHEIGHNLGSPHTHCYDSPVDTCFNAERGCYSGPVSCPAEGSGTLMSYCNFSSPSGAGCGQNRLELHPTVAGRISELILANMPACITTASSQIEGLIFRDRFQP